MNAFLGAQTEQLRDAGGSIGRGAGDLDRLFEGLSVSIDRVGWIGEDAETFRQMWHAQVGPAFTACADHLRRQKDELASHADEQDAASDADPAGGPGGDGEGWSQRGDGTSSGYRGESSNEDGSRTELHPEDREGDPEIPPGIEDWDKSDPNAENGHHAPDQDIDLDDRPFSVDDINQRGIGDCWFLASLGATARADPAWLREQISDNGDGTYTVTMYHEGEPVEITVEGTFNAAGTKGGDGQPNWASIYEKAAAEYMGGSYGDIVADQPELALEMITGNDARYADGATLEDIQGYLEDGPVVVDTKVEENGWWIFERDHVEADNIVPNHSYVVDAVEMREHPPGSGTMEQMIRVQNPWGPNAQVNENPGGSLWLTEAEFQENFRRTNYVDAPTAGE